MKAEGVDAVKALLGELKGDFAVPKNIREKIENVLETLDEESETYIKISKALNELEEIAEDANLESYTRTQIWDAISDLEKIK